MSAVLAILSPSEAQRLTQRIKLTASGVRDGLFKLRNLVDEAKSSNAWQVLGFASWTAYLADTLGSEPMRLDRSERQELVAYLSGEGMSTRAIAPIVGATKSQVARDIEVSSSGHLAPVPFGTPEPEPTPEPVADPVTGEVLDDEAVVTEHIVTEKTRTITGMDGKSYKTSESKPNRPPLPKQFFNAVYDLGKAIERVQRLTEDDRFNTNKGQFRDMHAADLTRSANTLAGVLELLNK